MALRTATPMGDWRSFKTICEVTAGVKGILEAGEDDALGARVSFLYLVEDAVGAVLESADFGEEVVIIYHAEKIMVPKMTESMDFFAPGMRVYWDPVTRLVTPNYDSGYYWIGMATERAAVGDMYVEIDLKGDHAEVEAILP